MNAIKKIAIKAAVLGMFGVHGLVFAQNTQMPAPDAIINFNGSIIDSQCAIKGGSLTVTPDNTAPIALTGPIVVTLGAINKKAFKGIGGIHRPTDFTIELIDCAATDNVSLTLNGAQITGNAGVLQLSSAAENTGAAGVGVLISNRDDSSIVLGNPIPVNSNGKLELRASYKQLAAIVTPGTAKAVLNVTLSFS